LQGHIALDTAVWPEGVTGHSLDTLARAALWRAGLDYRHGTGHGVGAALNVHEGPQGISFRPRQQPLIIGMIMSNEPGYYEDNKFGIRIENLAFIKDANTEFRFAGKGYMTMEPITFVPIETKLINVEILIQEEREWVNNYHQKVLAQVSPCLEGRERALAWLKKKTQPI
jgi:Xaa-Pro aminopeptidase